MIAPPRWHGRLISPVSRWTPLAQKALVETEGNILCAAEPWLDDVPPPTIGNNGFNAGTLGESLLPSSAIFWDYAQGIVGILTASASVHTLTNAHKKYEMSTTCCTLGLRQSRELCSSKQTYAAVACMTEEWATRWKQLGRHCPIWSSISWP